MKTIKVDTPDGIIEMTGECLESELIWSKDVEDRNHIKNGVYSTKQVPTDHFQEVWFIDGEKVKLSRFCTELYDKYMIKSS